MVLVWVVLVHLVLVAVRAKLLKFAIRSVQGGQNTVHVRHINIALVVTVRIVLVQLVQNDVTVIS